MKNKKSAKDIAFDKERAKFRSEIRKLTDCLNNKQKQIDGLNETIREKDIGSMSIPWTQKVELFSPCLISKEI